jgi:hypothetical protein
VRSVGPWAALLLAALVLGGPAAAAARRPQVAAEEILLSRREGFLDVFDRVDAPAGRYRWPLLGRPEHLVVSGVRSARPGAGAVVLGARGPFTLTYRLVPRGPTFTFVHRAPVAVGTLDVFLGEGLSGTALSRPKPRSITPVVVGRERLVAFAFGPLPEGATVRWVIAYGNPTAGVGAALEALALVAAVLGGLAAVWRLGAFSRRRR